MSKATRDGYAMKLHVEDGDEYREELFGAVNDIATAVERIADRPEPKATFGGTGPVEYPPVEVGGMPAHHYPGSAEHVRRRDLLRQLDEASQNSATDPDGAAMCHDAAALIRSLLP